MSHFAWSLRKYGDSWEVGQPRIRTITGRESVEILHRSWHATPQQALKALGAAQRALLFTPGPHLRVARGATARRLVARQAGISVRHLQRIEKGQAQPKAITLARIWQALDELEAERCVRSE